MSGWSWKLDVGRRGWLVVALAVVSGITDASGFVHLGGAFSSVMTGNMVLLGLAAGTGNGGLAARAGAAIVAFVAGCVIGGRVAGQPGPEDGVWPRAITRALAIELVIFVAYGIALEATGGNPVGDVSRTALLALNALALGLQSSAIQRFGVSGLSTTYLTGTLTTTIVHLSSGRPVRHVALNLQLLGALIVGAGIGGLVATHAMRVIPLLQIGGVGLVILMALTGSQETAPARRD
jgi:uncharacterized membrane protein YoaK (UPF0700 family)